MDAGHLAVRFAGSAFRHAERPATRVAVGEDWTVRTYAELATDVRRLAARLIEEGLEPGDRVAIFAPNLPEWTLTDLSLIHISEPTRLGMISYAVFCLKKK